ncbi:tetratricopeptide repeat-containing protein [Aridibaculum aurantiacum]|uniref:tetratricopeptide repeat-containing protein n=1 Tax=Aridibaculum aurantiacum TaxID=2810307 RepID=UPI001A95A0CF|nr:tetratricopeptide repeat-containing protein [Aridibaculum aurantiacum]
MSTGKCFVIMGFGIKTDLATGRKLDLNKSYNALIKPVVTAKGLSCIRADEILHTGIIDVMMYKELMEADIVIADLSTANPNAFYELGIRHALRPHTTIVISESKLPYPFDLNHVRITSYDHLCDVIDYDEVMRFHGVLGKTLDVVMQQPKVDSPVYTYLNGLVPPALQERAAQVAVEINNAIEKNQPARKKKSEQSKTMSMTTEQAEEAIKKRKYKTAKLLFGSVLDMLENDDDPANNINPYILQRLAFSIYKSKEPLRLHGTESKEGNHLLALTEAMTYLNKLDLRHTNDPETLSLAGSIEKKLYEKQEGDDHLAAALLYFQRSFYLLYSRYNGISLAYMYLCQANSAISSTIEEKIADLVAARRMWKMVIEKCNHDWKEVVKREQKHQHDEQEYDALSQEQTKNDLEQKFWIQVNKAEAYYGLGNMEAFQAAHEAASNIPHEKWMMESFEHELKQVKRHLKAVGYLIDPSLQKQRKVVVQPKQAIII